MGCIRGVKDRRFKFTQVLNSMLEDDQITLKSKGFITYCLSKHEKWEFHINHLVKVLKEGEKAIYSTIKECIDNGYAIKYQGRDGDGTFLSYDFIISDSKHEIEEIKKELESQGIFKIISPHACFGDAEKRDAENASHSNTDTMNMEGEQQTAPKPRLQKSDNAEATSGSFVRCSDLQSKKEERPRSSMLDKLSLTDDVIERIVSNYSIQEQEEAVRRTLEWPERLSDAKAIQHILKNKHTWKDNPTKSDVMDEKRKFFEDLKQYDGKIVANYRIDVGHNYVEFVCGSICKSYNIDNVMFVKEVKEQLKHLLSLHKE